MLIPGLIKDAPSNLKEVGSYKITVYTVFFFRENVAYQSTYKGKKWAAYLKVRWEALKKDLFTQGNYYGISWEMETIEE